MSKYALDDILKDSKTLKDLTNEKLVELIGDGRLTPNMFLAVEEEYIKRLKGEKDA